MLNKWHQTSFDVKCFRLTFAFSAFVLYLCISKGSAEAFPFFLIANPPTAPQPPKGGFSFLKCGGIRPKWVCKRASLRFSFGPDDRSSMAVSHCRSGRMRKLAGRMSLIRRMARAGKTGREKLRVRLFRNLSKFRTIYDIASPSCSAHYPTLSGRLYPPLTAGMNAERGMLVQPPNPLT